MESKEVNELAKLKMLLLDRLSTWAEEIRREKDYGSSSPIQVAQDLGRVIIEDGYIKPVSNPDLEKEIKQMLCENTQYQICSSCKYPSGEFCHLIERHYKQLLSLLSQPQKELTLIEDIGYCDSCQHNARCNKKLKVSKCQGFVYWRLGTQYQLAHDKEKGE